ncbi:hypothetical protein BX265_6153 [Streptomyces sp. TLI_235]|nr:hypothetical protein [Streptomyces sp. TLI_235]PBC71543.1 hypothetical protein BX265_6153 [Streptomyces sp. TLI_235]
MTEKHTLRHDRDGYTVAVYFPPTAPWSAVEAFFDRVTEDAHAIAGAGWDAIPVGLPGDWLGIAADSPDGTRATRPDEDTRPDPTTPTHAELLALIDDLRDDDPCHYDHHGYCQAHSWFAVEPPCPDARAAALFAHDVDGGQP